LLASVQNAPTSDKFTTDRRRAPRSDHPDCHGALLPRWLSRNDDARARRRLRRERATLGEELAKLSEAGDDIAYFTRVGEILINFYEQNPAFIRLLFFSALEKHELAELFFTRMSCKFLEMIAGYIQRRIDAGHLRKVHPAIAAKQFCGGLSDYSLWRITCQFKTEDLPPKEVYLREVVSIFLNGVKA
jgi:AcrR family transcriptional regulator